jgi:guanosine-3',5'-bis(diphosphate) 3'-pyrophosphohydrolase
MTSNNFLPLFFRARSFAIDKHETQFYGKFPYAVHLNSVVSTLFKFKILPDCEDSVIILMSAWLHDVIEDTNTSKENLSNEFGNEVAEIVYCVTDVEGFSREEKKTFVLQKIKTNQNAIIVKLADRISNIEACILDNNAKKLSMYLSEQKELSDVLKPACNTKIGLEMFEYLESLIQFSNS